MLDLQKEVQSLRDREKRLSETRKWVNVLLLAPGLLTN
jgi:hypothetical protein